MLQFRNYRSFFKAVPKPQSFQKLNFCFGSGNQEEPRTDVTLESVVKVGAAVAKSKFDAPEEKHHSLVELAMH